MTTKDLRNLRDFARKHQRPTVMDRGVPCVALTRPEAVALRNYLNGGKPCAT